MPAISLCSYLPWLSYHPRQPRQVKALVAVAGVIANKCRQCKQSIKVVTQTYVGKIEPSQGQYSKGVNPNTILKH